MAYEVIEDFRAGVDRRRRRVTGFTGALWKLENAIITSGGAIKGRKRFVSKYSLPAGTFGLHASNGSLYTFGSTADPGVPSGVTYQRLQHTASAAMSALLAAENFDGKIYAIAEFDNGDVYHYYNGSRVTTWDTVAATVASNNNVAAALADKIDAAADFSASDTTDTVTITAAVAGVGFTAAKSTTNGGSNPDQDITLATTQANVEAVTEVLSTASFSVTGGTASAGTNKLASITIDGIEVLNTAVDWATSNSATATAIAAQINSYNSSPEYTTAAVGSTVRISAAAATGSGPNGFTVVMTVGGDVTVSPTSTTMAGGVTAVTAVAQVVTAQVTGTFEADDTFTVTLNGVDYTVSGASSGTGRTALTHKQKVYSGTQSLNYFCEVGNPNQWGSGTGTGFINHANHDAESETVKKIIPYQGNIAVMARNNVQIWFVDPDPDLNTFLQPVSNTGTRSPDSVVNLGNNDVFYLADVGIRSLRSRDSSNAAYATDVGTAIDPFVKEILAGFTDTQIEAAAGIIEPENDRYILSVGGYVFVFNYFPGAKISAWSWWTPTEVENDAIEGWARTGNRLYARAGDTVYLYGGDDNATYLADTDADVTVELPFMTASKPATRKTLHACDIVGLGEWAITAVLDPNDETVESETFRVTGTTTGEGDIPIHNHNSHHAFKLVADKGGEVMLESFIMHFTEDDSD